MNKAIMNKAAMNKTASEQADLVSLRAKALGYLEDGCTCALVSEEKTLQSKRRGVQPLLGWLQSGEAERGMIAADKVVGKAAAFLYVLIGVAEVHAKVLSASAEAVLQRFAIPYFYEERVAAIKNRTNTGFCPMENAVWEIDEPQAAYAAIQEKWKQLNGGENS